MTDQLANKRTEILAIATSLTAHLCNWYNHMFALLIRGGILDDVLGLEDTF